MFTGIIEATGTIRTIGTEGANRHFEIESPISQELKVDQSVAHDGVCLTVTRVEQTHHWVTAVKETLERSTLGRYKPGSVVNLERCMLNNGRFDGHIVQGHVDTTALVQEISEQEGSWEYTFKINNMHGHVMVEKGSVTINGISLTCYHVRDNSFRVAIIPYTHEHTNISRLKKGDLVNIEFDIIGKYVERLLTSRGRQPFH